MKAFTTHKTFLGTEKNTEVSFSFNASSAQDVM